MRRSDLFEAGRPTSTRAGNRRKRLQRRPELVACEVRVLPSGLIAAGSGPGSAPLVTLHDASTGVEVNRFQAYPSRARGGVEVAIGDVDADGVPDLVTANGPGARTVVQVFRGSDGALLARFAVGPAGYAGGASLALGDVDSDGRNDVIVGRSRGPAVVSVYQAAGGTPLASFSAYGPAYRGGVRVATGDFDRDGRADVATVNATGRPDPRVIAVATDSTLVDLGAPLPWVPRGGTSIAAGDVDGDGKADLILAGATGAGRPAGARVRVFGGGSGSLLADFVAAGRRFAAGARAVAVDAGGDLTDAIAVAPAAGGASLVFNTSGLRREARSPFAAAFATTARAPQPTTPMTTAPPVAAVVFAGRGGSLAATSSSNEQVPSAGARLATPTSGLAPLGRLAYYDAASGQFVTVAADDARLAGKHVYVIAHGWAPGYLAWVNSAASLGQTLTWWQTFPAQPGYNPGISGGLAPASNFLLDPTSADAITISGTGLSQTLTTTDPDAAVLAFSWIDDSATPVDSVGIPQDADLSEARTTLNGLRLAAGLRQTLGDDFAGRLQLIGHSHGSKVVTVAAGALAGSPGSIRVDQLTILDSPEASDTALGLSLAEDGAANNNWYFLQALAIDRAAAAGTVVDNYVSYFDSAYGGISGLGQVVDVTLYPYPFGADQISGKHAYSATWYAGSAQSAINDGRAVGRLWSPLLAGNSGPDKPPANLLSGYEQSWSLDYFSSNYFSQANQFDLEANPPPATSFVFSPVSLPASMTPGVAIGNASTGATVSLTQMGGSSQSYLGGFITRSSVLDGIRGITFRYAFPSVATGDTLTITVDGTPAFVMDATLLGPVIGLGTLSLGDVTGGENHTLGFYLGSTQPNTSSQAVISDIRQFSY